MAEGIISKTLINILGGKRVANIYSIVVAGTIILFWVSRLINYPLIKTIINYFATGIFFIAFIFFAYRTVLFLVRKK